MKPASDTADELTRLTDEEILALVETRSQRFQRQIRFRDWRELIAGGIAAVMIAPAVLRGPLLARAGALTILAGIGLVAFRLFAARRLTASGDVELSFRQAPRSVDASTASGDVDVLVPEGEAYRVEADSGSGEQALDVRTDPASTRIIRAQTSSGDVTVAYGN